MQQALNKLGKIKNQLDLDKQTSKKYQKENDYNHWVQSHLEN